LVQQSLGLLCTYLQCVGSLLQIPLASHGFQLKTSVRMLLQTCQVQHDLDRSENVDQDRKQI